MPLIALAGVSCIRCSFSCTPLLGACVRPWPLADVFVWYGISFFHVQVQGIGEDQDSSPVRHGPAKLIPGQASIPDGDEGSDAINAAGADEDSRRSLDSTQGQGSVADASPSVDDGGEKTMHSTSAPMENDTSAPGEEESVSEISVEEWRKRHRTRDLDREGQPKTSDADGQNDQRPNNAEEKTHDLCETGQECMRKEALPELDPLPGA